MPKAERGTPKDTANRMKSRGLQKLAYWCQACEKQMRDQNGFKQHCASEPHVRRMLEVGERPQDTIGRFSAQFKRDFLQLLRTGHGEKRISANQFYQEYIQNKTHTHMNGTHWKTLSEFCKSLGREGICRVEDTEKGLFIAWVDNSPEALARQAAIKKKERQDKGDEERANMLLAEQIQRARAETAKKEAQQSEQEQETSNTSLHAKPEEKVKISFGLGKPIDGGISKSAPKKSIFQSMAKSNVQRPEAANKDQNPFSKKPISHAQQIIIDDQLRTRRQRT